jgi:hypothetical protein
LFRNKHVCERRHISVYADYVNLLGDNIDTIMNNTGTFIDTSKEVGLEINTEITNFIYIAV